MAESTSSANPSSPPPNGSSNPSTPPKPQNPALRMLGLPNFRFKLPSRNWLIFLTITGSFAGALIYDRREKRKVQQKWSNLVAHIAREPLQTSETRRKLTVFLAAPPGDGLFPAREHFKEYVKPVLVASAMDYDVVEGRREGDIRAALANRIRKGRRQAGERGSPGQGDEDDVESAIRSVRTNLGVHNEAGERGDLVIGRHTWKEYVRGLHEGWLGPLDPPPPPASETATTSPTSDEQKQSTESEATDTTATSPAESENSQQEQKEPEPTQEKKKEQEKPQKPAPTPAYILPSQYSSQQTAAAPSIPREFQPSSPIVLPHLLGILNTPIRVYRFLTRRRLADSVGRDVAAVALASSTRPYSEFDPSFLEVSESDHHASPTSSSSSSPSSARTPHYEQQSVLANEEKEWHKSVHRAPEDPSVKEREWLDDVVIDPRIGSRMRRFTLAPDEEARAARIGEGKEWIKGEEKPPDVPMWKRLWKTYGWGAEDPRANVVIGNIDGEDGKQ